MKKIIIPIIIIIISSSIYYSFGVNKKNNTKSEKTVSSSVQEVKGKKAKDFLVEEFRKKKIKFDHKKSGVKYISSDGSGDYNCDWKKAKDQEILNEALNFIEKSPEFNTLYLKKNTKCIIDDTIFIGSNTILTGDKTAVIKLKDNVAWWKKNKPMIGQKNRQKWGPWGEKGDNISNVEIFGFEIDGGLQLEPTGKTYIPLIHFAFPKNIKIHDMYLHNSRWDIIRLSSIGVDDKPFKTDSKIYNNLIITSGHEGICFVGLSDFEVFKNKIFNTRTNSGIRLKDTNNFSIHNNTIGNSLLNKKSSGYSGILVENEFAKLDGKAEIFENLIYGKNGGIHLGGRHYNVVYKTGTRKNVHIFNNRIYKTKNMFTAKDNYPMAGGIRINGYQNTLIENNIIDGGTTNGIIYEGDIGTGNGYSTIVKNNFIINNNGYGISNIETSRNKFILENNIIYNNKKGNYQNIESNKDIYKIPSSGENYEILQKWEKEKKNILVF